ncbi:MAG: hypothetical protein J5726_04695 [Treponema sp.]|nr:hypothetical protein [Treponema sp.]
MKKALKLVLMYFLVLLIGTAIGMFFYTIYLSVQGAVAGTPFSLFNKTDLLRALFYVLLCVFIFVCPVMVYIRISNNGGIAHFIFFILLSGITWAICVPALLHYESKVMYNVKDSSKMLTGGYFRENNGKIYYFTSDYNVNPYLDTTSIVIDTDPDGQVDIQNIKPTQDFFLFRESAPYKDSLIKNTMDEHKPKYSIISFDLIKQCAVQAFAKKWTFWLGFFSLGLVLASLYGAASLFRWKLLNSGFLMLATFLILAANTLYFHPVFVSFRRQHLDPNRFFVFLSKYIDNPFLVLCNVLFSLILLIIGIVCFATRKKRMY